jgi:hypothetical protein
MTNNYLGYYQIKVVKDGKVVSDEVVKNRIMDTVLSQLIGAMKASAPDLEIKYLALGDSSTAVTDTDTQLGNEVFRTAYATRTDGVTGELKHNFVVLDNEAVGTINEIGIFGGSTATSTANSGTLISRILWSRTKTPSEEIQFIRTDKIARG